MTNEEAKGKHPDVVMSETFRAILYLVLAASLIFTTGAMTGAVVVSMGVRSCKA